jgi:hypothetical protein
VDAPGFARLATARLVALYLLSLLATAGAQLAWGSPGPARLAAHAVALGLAVALGRLLPDALSVVGTAAVRTRARLLAFFFLPPPGLLALAVALFEPRLAEPAVSALAALQVAVLLFGEALGIELLAVWGALLLTILAAVAGGWPAAVGLGGFLLLAGFFFALDGVLERLADWPRVPAPALRPVLADALRTLAPPVVLLLLALPLLPAPAAPADSESFRPPLDVSRAYPWLGLVALAGGGTMALVLRWLRGGRSEAPTLVELAEGRVEAEELLEPDRLDDARYAPSRGRIIRAYLRFLSRAREAGLHLERHLTPREIQDRVRRPEESLGTLTRLFMDARYGPDEPASAAVRSAEAAASEVCSRLRGRPRRRRPAEMP